MWHIWGTEQVHMWFWWGEPDGKRPLVRSRRRSENNVKWIFKKCDEEAWTGSRWLRIGTAGGRL